MPDIDVNGKKIEVDEDGFLVNLDDWDEDVAKYLAEQEGINELNEDHWKVIQYLKDYFKEYGIAPMVRKLTKESGYSLKQIYDLFPSGPAKGACKIAGLPKPTGCV
ncbi:MAG: TusE/DsrC/DsvC family sulfur relay protein [Clostridiales bacterium]|uniref:tRNA 2-thiouridine synthesizing protein E n=1 Tax=Peptococcus niger TaxID=2741 RepID=A0A1G6UKA9_PEPNI|nr:TusE/DsrC/DsvC family sulfur relay protein [Peptococcus niger]MBS5594457.1 TusE/DsrC/DsvC family sulfur relay protein [Clostridiales bacterium]MDU7504902.1 TusE/DsrC/DsvC family sulfur relay protein [Clostridia bacterium]MBS5916291.1 TusE/DsrC/DsvC family sulfur relay protein [Clostridiales bacterium]MDU1028197.1 TusE/DsrC/DsvC family sulfur relay protein [Clostridiales bacterium]MDU2292635.1 TusE/DsrC/DsvC family sulfur relay protein [Peptococcus niger]